MTKHRALEDTIAQHYGAMAVGAGAVPGLADEDGAGAGGGVLPARSHQAATAVRRNVSR
jgi:hypothetical protein